MRVDFNLPKRFKITHVGADRKEHEVIIIHRALLGAIERFFAILIEHCTGNFPTWLAPTQVEVLPISEDNVKYAEKAHRKLLLHGIRSEIDNDTSTINYRIRNAELRKIPYMAIVGRREVETERLSVRKHGAIDIGLLTIQELVRTIRDQH